MLHKMLGKWQSEAYQSYMKTPPRALAKFSKLLILQNDKILKSPGNNSKVTSPGWQFPPSSHGRALH